MTRHADVVPFSLHDSDVYKLDQHKTDYKYGALVRHISVENRAALQKCSDLPGRGDDEFFYEALVLVPRARRPPRC